MVKKKKKKGKRSYIPVRMNLMFFVIFILFSLLILRLGMVQIVFGQDYLREVQRTTDVTVSNSVPRGKIFEANGNAVVDNAPVNAITYTRTPKTKQEDMIKVAKNLAKLIKQPITKITEREQKDYWIIKYPNLADKKLTAKEKKDYEKKKDGDAKLYQMKLDRITKADLSMLTDDDKEVLAIYREMIGGYNLTPQIIKNENVTNEEFAQVSAHLKDLPGVDITTDWNRIYPFGDTLKTILGKISDRDSGLPLEEADAYVAKGYNRNERVGTSYIEKQYEDVLQGQKEKIKNITDKSGSVVSTEVIQKGRRGDDLVLSIDMELQKRIEKIIGDELLKSKQQPGHQLLDRVFVNMLNPYTGEIKAMAGKRYKLDNGKPVLEDFALGNITSSYAMGSAVKGATVLTGYKTGAISPGEQIVDEPLHIKGTPTKASYVRGGMGRINDLTALKRSSNVYMFKTAIAIGHGHYVPKAPLDLRSNTFDILRTSFRQFGLGTRTGIDLPGEQVGFKGQDTTNPGFILDYAIGQYDTFTPLQLAQYMSTIANGGYRMQTHLVKEIRQPVEASDRLGPIVEEIQPKVLNKLDMKPEWINRVKEGFREVAQEPGGTGHSTFYSTKYSSEPTTYKPAVKTGTAQGPYAGDNPNYSHQTLTWNLTMAGYAPYDHPEVAFSVVVPWAYQEDAYNQGINYSIAKKVMDAYFDLKKEREEKGMNQSTSVQKVQNIKDVKKGQEEARKENEDGKPSGNGQ
ncbi:peptidoglycan D,D-transpeptidase FtsI family protein [Falsibacillus albus]|uniref:serine-type D-Ala-D-Ala carboxypeptidase n=1 Tax=Falsibacillus albus TaxID=2478915 RepID=A0A3L7K2K9_9BACI|nr:penicillin-binding protein 2 [Falsibacillus albus]RLQ96855.1 penicillin-binding protein 2 [Falsibacillus albus]